MEHTAKKKTAHILSVILKISGMMAGVCSILLAVGFLALIFTYVIKPEYFAAVLKESGLSYPDVLIFVGCCLAWFGSAFLLLINGARLSRNIWEKGSPFQKENIRYIQKIGLGGLLAAAIPMFPFEGLQVLPIVGGILFYLLASCMGYVFAYGIRLEERIS